jgi:hypothetical protein
MSAVAIVAVVLSSFLGAPDLRGLATYYDHGTVFRSGEPFHLDAGVCAVDVSEWDRLRGQMVVVLAESGHVAVLRVADTGYLYRAGVFTWGIRGMVARWWPNAAGERVVLDVPRETFRKLSPDLGTVRVWVWAR